MNAENHEALPDLEVALKKLEQIVVRMEREKLSIEVAMAEFEAGIRLVGICQQRLQQAEQKVQLLLEGEGKTLLVPYQIDQNTEV